MDQNKLLKNRSESFYNWDKKLDDLKEKLMTNEYTCILASAPFGWGKSSFTNILLNELEIENKEKRFVEKPWDINVIETWKYELLSPNDVVTQLIYDILDTFYKKLIKKYLQDEILLEEEEFQKFLKYRWLDEKKIKLYAKEGIFIYFQKYHNIDDARLIKLTKMINKSNFQKKLEQFEKLIETNYVSVLRIYEEFLRAFIEDIEEASSNKNLKMLYIFRDCDRCSPENLLKIIDVLFHLQIDNRIKFIVEADEDTIKSILCKKYHLGDFFELKFELSKNDNSKFEGVNRYKSEILNGYLDKIFQKRINLRDNPFNKSVLIQYLNQKLEFTIKNEDFITIEELALVFGINYRFIKFQIEDTVLPRLRLVKLIPENRDIQINVIIILHILNELYSQAFRTFQIPELLHKEEKYGNNNIQKIFYNKTRPNLFSFMKDYYAGELDISQKGHPKYIAEFINSIRLTTNDNRQVRIFNFNLQFFSKKDPRAICRGMTSIINSINDTWNDFNKITKTL